MEKQSKNNLKQEENQMRLQTTLIITHQSTFKPTNKTQFAHFAHPLKVLPKTDDLMEEIFDNQHFAEQLYKSIGFQCKQQSGKSLIPSQLNNSSNNRTTNPTSKTKIQTYNEQVGILKHIIIQNYLSSMSSTSCSNKNAEKCFILYGFSIQINKIQEFLNDKFLANTESCWKVKLQIFKYSDSRFYQEYEFSQNPEDKTKKMIELERLKQKFQGCIDCQDFTFIISLTSNKQNISSLKLYFFPNINAIKSSEDKQLVNLFSISDNYCSNARTSQTNNNHATPSQIRKSHQNFRLLQVLEYYLNLDCNSDHMIISSNQSKVIRHFLNFIYTEQIKEFYLFIDHEKKVWNKTNKSTARSIYKSKELIGKQSGTTSVSKMSRVSQVYTSDILSQLQFINIDGQIIINDQFLSKLGEIRLPQFWLDNEQFRSIKKRMYLMKLQQNTFMKQIRQAKSEFTDRINYLNILTGIPKLSYDQITIETLKTIKGAKVRQNTLQLKDLISISQNLKIRHQNLLKKKEKFKQSKKEKDQFYVTDLSSLRKQILNIQKKVSMGKNDLNELYFEKQNQNQHVSTTNESNSLNTKNTSQKKLLAKISKNSRSSMNGSITNLLAGRKSSNLLMSKYGPMIQQLRKKKYEQSVKKLKTQAQFESQKDYEKWKTQYSVATYQLKAILEELQ